MSRNLRSSVDSSSSSTSTTTSSSIDSTFLKSNEAEVVLQSKEEELQKDNGGSGRIGREGRRGDEEGDEEGEVKDVKVVEDVLNTESDSVEDLLTTLMKQLKGSEWLKEATKAAVSQSTSISDNSNDGLIEIKEAVDIENLKDIENSR